MSTSSADDDDSRSISSNKSEEAEYQNPSPTLPPPLHPDARTPHPNISAFIATADFCWLNWKDCLPDVRNQGDTNGCYAMVVVTTMYAHEYILNPNQIPCLASAQELLDLLHRHDKNAPVLVNYKGLPNSFKAAFEYVIKHGLYPEYMYPWEERYQFFPKKLNQPEKKIHIKNFGWIDDNDHDAVVQRLRRQPVAAGIILYKSFVKLGVEDIVYEGPTKEELQAMEQETKAMKALGRTYSPPLHAVTLIGYGGRKGIDDYYLCQNSAGRNWGHHGYCKIRRTLVFGFSFPIATDVADLTDEIERLATDPMDTD